MIHNEKRIKRPHIFISIFDMCIASSKSLQSSYKSDISVGARRDILPFCSVGTTILT